MYSDDLRDAPADEVPVEWVFEAHDDADEEVLSPPASGASKSWLSWLQGTPAPKGHQYSRESDASAGSLPQESEPSREPPDLTPSAPASAAKPSGYTGILGWMTGQAFADEPDAPLPAPLPSRLDPEDEESVRHSSPSAPARSVVEIDIPGGMFSEDEVIGERNVHRAASTATNAPPASSSAASRRAAPRHAEDISRPQKLPDRQVSFDMDGIPGPDSERPRKHTDPDDFIARFNHADAAEAVAAVTASDDLVPPPLPPPNEPPAPEEEQGFYEIHEASPEAVLIANVGQAVMEEQPKEVDREVEGRGPSKQDAHPATIPEEPQADVAVVVDPDTEPEDDSPEGQQPQRRRCLACCCNKAPRKKQKPKAVEDTASEDYRHQQSKLLDEEIEDFSGTPFVTFVAWITHRGLARAPMCCVCSGMLLVIAIIAGGMVARPPNVDVDWGAFLKTDVNTSTMRDVFLFALQHRQTERRLTEETELVEDRRLQGNRLYKHSDIFLAYDFPDDANAGPNGWLDSGHLYSVMSLERRLRSTAMWQQLCNRSDDVDKPLCEQGISLVNYVFPSPMVLGPDVVPSMLVYDAGGREKVAPQVAVALMEEHNVKDIIVDADYEDGQPLRRIRSCFRFKWYCCTSLMSSSEQGVVLEEMRQTWDTFLNEAVMPILKEFREAQAQRAAEGSGTKPFEMYYTGSTLYSKEVTETLLGDLLLAAGSMGFVLFYLMVHTQSVLLGSLGLLLIVSAIPLSYVLFSIVTGSNTMSIASLLSVFLIVGLGSDVVFVYTDFWADSALRKENFGSRMTWTLIHAGKASLATSVTTALSFFANLASVLKPLREFGFFMGLCVVVCWVLLSLIYLPLCMLTEYWCGRSKSRCASFTAAFRTDLKEAMSSVRFWKSSTSSKAAKIDAYPYTRGYTRCLQRAKRSLALFPIVVCLGLAAWGSMVFEVDSGVPSIFPADHNLNRGQQIFATFNDANQVFNPLWTIDTPQVSVCNDAMFAPMSTTYTPASWGYNCNLFWCEADPDVEQSEEGSCHCWRRQLPNTCNTQSAPVSSKIYAKRKLAESEMVGAVADYLASAEGMQMTSAQRQSMQRATVIAPVVTEEWERGVKEVREITEVVGRLQRESRNSSSCGFQDMCFCTTWSCKMLGTGWQQVDPLSIPTISDLNFTTRRLQSGLPKTQARGRFGPQAAVKTEAAEALQAGPLVRSPPTEADFAEEASAQPRWLQNLSPSEWTVAPANRAGIDIIFGIEVTTSAKLLGEVDLENGWQFAELHQVSQPWAQRNMYSFCTSMPRELRVVERKCWMEDFRAYLLNRGDRFPIIPSQFEQQIIPFAESWLTGMHSTKDYMWIRDGKVKASYMLMSVDFQRYADTTSAIEYKKLWDKYLEEFNLDASIYTKGAWHTSSLWVRAEAQSALISSTILTIVIVVGLALLGMLVFTRDWKLSMLVVASTMLVVCILFWFIVVVMGWPIGAIEVIALIVFIGYAVTYSLHIAHRYGSADAQDALVDVTDADVTRFVRTVYALGSIGRAALGSAATTAGCSIFLVFCTLTIFQKLGGVVLVVTLMSIGVALIPLPATLLWMGPLRPGFCWCLRPFETYDNVVNARSNMVANLEKRREESRKRQEQRKEEAEQKKLEKEEAKRQAQAEKEKLKAKLPPAKDEQKKKKEEEDAVKAQEAARAKEAEEAKRKELAAKAKQIAAAKAKAKAAAEAAKAAAAKPTATPAEGASHDSLSPGRGLSAGDYDIGEEHATTVPRG